jgi:hypothetical protein
MAAQRLPVRIGPVPRDVVQTQEPGVLGIHHHQSAARILQRRVAQGHIVRHGPQFARPRKRQETPLARHQVAT